MVTEVLASDEESRLAALRAYNVLDTLPEPAFNELVLLASEICEVPIALMSLVDRDRQWFKATIGLDVTETPRSKAFCSEAIRSGELFVVPNALVDARFMDSPLVTSDPQIRFYAGTPLQTQDGQKLGTLCVLDRVARELTPVQERALRTLGHQIETQLELRRKLHELALRETELRIERDQRVRVERQKEELAAFIVHDLKNPLMSIVANADFVRVSTRDAEVKEAVEDIATTVGAMQRIVLDLLDIRKSDEGTLVPLRAELDLVALVREVGRHAERRARSRRQTLHVTTSDAGATVQADRDLLRRVLENLLDNAFKYVPDGGTIGLVVRTASGGASELEVRDDGPGIPATARGTIFDRYVLLGADSSANTRASHGLGLAFCRLAVEAHGGSIWVEDNVPQGSVFCVRLPGWEQHPEP